MTVFTTYATSLAVFTSYADCLDTSMSTDFMSFRQIRVHLKWSLIFQRYNPSLNNFHICHYTFCRQFRLILRASATYTIAFCVMDLNFNTNLEHPTLSTI